MFRNHITPRAVAVGAALTAGAFGVGATISASSPAARSGAQHATAVLVDADGDEVGVAKLVEDGTGRVHVNVKVSGLSPGLHGIHVHAVAACDGPAFTSAGGHHNPSGASHGAHNGDLPNLVVNGAGRGRLNGITERLTLSAGPTFVFDADGSAIIVHDFEDDGVTDPTGSSGARIACGVITPS